MVTGNRRHLIFILSLVLLIPYGVSQQTGGNGSTGGDFLTGEYLDSRGDRVFGQSEILDRDVDIGGWNREWQLGVDLDSDSKFQLAYWDYGGDYRSLVYAREEDGDLVKEKICCPDGAYGYERHEVPRVWNNVRLRVDPQGQPHILWQGSVPSGEENAYKMDHNLMYSYKVDGSWKTEVVEKSIPHGFVIDSIAFDSQGRPVISYPGTDKVPESSSLHYRNFSLKYAVHKAGGWDKETISVNNRQVWANLLDIDSKGNHAIASIRGDSWFAPDKENLSRIQYRERDGNDWNLSVIESHKKYMDVSKKYSGYRALSFQFDREDNPVILYTFKYKYERYDLFYATRTGGSWEIQKIDSLETGENEYEDEMATFTDLAIDSDNNLHIIYNKKGPGTRGRDLRYATLTDDGWQRKWVPTGQEILNARLEIDDDDVLHLLLHTRLPNEEGSEWIQTNEGYIEIESSENKTGKESGETGKEDKENSSTKSQEKEKNGFIKDTLGQLVDSLASIPGSLTGFSLK